MPKARIRDRQLEEMTKSEAEQAITEAKLGDEDERIARLYLMRQQPQEDIAAQMGYERSTISRRWHRIQARVRHTRRMIQDRERNEQARS